MLGCGFSLLVCGSRALIYYTTTTTTIITTTRYYFYYYFLILLLLPLLYYSLTTLPVFHILLITIHLRAPPESIDE